MNANINPNLESLCRPLEGLKPDPRNARKHSERNIQAISESLMMYGQQKPIVVKSGTVIAGNGTFEAAKRLGWKKIAVTEFNAAKGTAMGYALADNRTAELAEWDFDVLSSQLGLFESQLELGYLWSAEEQDALKTLNRDSTGGTIGMQPEERKAIFDANTIKQIVLYLDDAQYKVVLEKFRDLGKTHELETNTEVVLHLLTAYENTRN